MDDLRNLITDLRDIWGRSPADRRAIITLIAGCILLLVFGLWGRPGFLRGQRLEAAAGLFGLGTTSEYYSLTSYLYWAATSVVVRILAPCFAIWFVLKEHPRDFGYRIRGTAKHAWVYLLLFAAMLPVITAVSFGSAFQLKYPMYGQAIRGWSHFIPYEIAYGIQFFGVEAFFRGFLTFGLYPRFGYYALLVMVIPYSMVHFGKPPLEVFAAIPAGLILGFLALRTGSWLYGALLHWAVGITMDLAAILQKGGFQG
jgi:membrane protease YdiL (CAAX protease family)